MKGLGCVLVLLGSFGMGLVPVWELRERAERLRLWQCALLRLEGETTFSLRPLPELLRSLAKGSPDPVGRTLCYLEQGMAELGERPFAQIWRETMERYSGLAGEDLAPLTLLGELLGRFDAPGQGRALEDARERLADRERQCREDARVKGRAYGALGLTAGAFAVLLLV